ncbi:hypothetical protein [Arsukibacterium indicum]|uniref:Uncharacterized protein n=1 Tax=Arsukibacterium indicum TaxID=2848612 RepID=A0ABS6MLR4_9GAMM|nr:hypothetical protein [Arsukibacterium indicum]MBV2129757.1 hypothetical protein [Arsukibacterium indicum]
MQKLLVWFSALLIIVVSFPGAAEKLTGKWRGKMQMAPQAALTLGININNTPEGYSLTIDSPNQGMFDYQPSQFSIDSNSVQFQDDKLNASFSGSLVQGQLQGTFVQGKARELNLTKLDEQQLKLLENEGSWYGDLIINNSARLPLVLNIAVAGQDYHVTLDSPKQQSFGIPVDKFSISSDKLEFSSAIINASYSATLQDGNWQGTFVQGAAMPLVLKKKPD